MIAREVKDQIECTKKEKPNSLPFAIRHHQRCATWQDAATRLSNSTYDGRLSLSSLHVPAAGAQRSSSSCGLISIYHANDFKCNMVNV